MAFSIHSLDQFRKLRKDATSWRNYESALSSLKTDEAEIIRGVLMVPTVDGRSDPDYEKRLYDGFKEAMERTKAGRPLSDTPPSTARPKPSYQERILQAGRELGYLSEPALPEAPLSPAVSWAPTTPSPPTTPPPSSPHHYSFSPPTSPPTPSPPRGLDPSPEGASSPPTPIVTLGVGEAGLSGFHPKVCRPRASPIADAVSRPCRPSERQLIPHKPRQPTTNSIRLGLQARKRTTPTKRHNYPAKRRVHQLKFDDTVLAEVRNTPPLTRARLRKEVVARLVTEIAQDTV